MLDPDNAVDESINHPFSYGISTSVRKLLEYITRAYNGYVQGHTVMLEIQEKMIRITAAQGISQ